MSAITPSSTPTQKKIIGVPVLPGFPPSPGVFTIDHSDSSDAADDSAETVSVQSGPIPDDDKVNSVSSLAPKWTLGHIDFLPKSIKDDYEKFPKVVTSANQWLRENRHARLFSCETVKFVTSGDRNLYTDSGVYVKSMHSDKKNKTLVGLRVWYYTTDDTFYDETQVSSNPASSIGYRNYVGDHKSNTTTASLVLKIGEEMTAGDLGKVLRIESNTHLLDSGDADTCFWREEPQSNRQFYTFFRVFYLEGHPETAKVTQFGVQDFLPKYDARSPHNQGYETFSELWKRAARWLYTNTNIHVFNFQSFFVKYKKEDDPNSVTIIDRLVHTEHGSAYSSMTSKKTEYVQIIRAFYAKSSHGQFKPDAKQDLSGRKCFYKTFAPSRLSKDDAEELTDVSYQDLRQMEDKLNSWLNFSGARLVTLETIPVRLKTGGQESIGAEATFVYNEREKNMSKEYWRNNIRLYIAGEFRQPPDQWRRVMTDR